MPDDTRSRPGPPPEDQLLPRRRVLQFAGSAIAIASLPALEGCTADAGAPQESPLPPPESELDEIALANALTVTVLRKEDMTVLDLVFVNLDLRNKASAPPPDGTDLTGSLWLGKTDPSAAAYIVAIFQPQHILEQTFDEGATPSAPPINHRIAQPSRLAFRVPSQVTAIPYELDAILRSLSQYPLNVVATATPEPQETSNLTYAPLFFVLNLAAAATTREKTTRGIRAARQRQVSASFTAVNPDALPRISRLGEQPLTYVPPPLPTKPTEMQTSIELPFRLQISPNGHARFQHATAPVVSTKSKRVEVWHTRLTTPEAWQKTIRGVWTRDPGFDPNDANAPLQGQSTSPAAAEPFYASLFQKDRADIVHLTTNRTLKDSDGQPRARAVPTKSLMLSALGGWLEAHGAWKNGVPSLVNWDHIAGLGRDQYVRVVNVGYLYPYGHEAVWVRISERKLAAQAIDTAYMYTRQFLVVTQPLMTYDDLAVNLQRGLPFRSIRFKTTTTPLLAPLSTQPVLQYSGFPYLPDGMTPFRFEVQAFDHDGNVHDFETAAIWVDAADAANVPTVPVTATILSTKWAQEEQRRRVPMKGQRVAMAESDDVDDTRYAVKSFLPRAQVVAGVKGAPFRPQLETADVEVDAIRGLTGDEAATTFLYNPTYLAQGFGPGNPGAVFMQLGDVAAPANLNLHSKSDRSGGFVAPSVAVTGLSRAQGIIGGDADKFAKGLSSPADFFKGIKAKLFGVLDLFDIIADLGVNKLLEQAPKFVAQAMQAVEEVFQIVDAAKQLADAVSAQVPQMQSLASTYLPAQPWTLKEDAREALVQGMVDAATLSAADGALLLRVWSKAAALGKTAAEVQALCTGMLASVNDLADKAQALADALDQVAQIGPSTSLQDLADAILASVKGARTAIDGVSTTLGVNPLPIDDGARLSLGKLADKLAKIFPDQQAVTDFETAVLAFVSAEEAIKNLHVKLEWAPELQPWPKSAAIFWPKDKKGLRVGVEARGKASGGHPAGAEVYASLVDFELRLLGDTPYLKLVFDKLIFKAGTSGKPEIDCVFRGLHFGGPLEFVEVLRDFIPLDGFSDPPNVVVDEDGLKANFTLALPSVAIGVFSLENISFSAGFEIPFIGDSLTVSFAFCSRDEPFVLTVCMLGGGGFVGIHLAPDGMRKLEIALEARAALSLDFGVASGSISVALGIYIAIESEKCTLTGYLRLRGEVDVLGGLIAASIELYMELTYETDTGKVTGYAKIEISITVLFFTGTVTVECERKFRGSNGDPTFRELMAYDPITSFAPWEEYCDAFAPAA